MCSCQRTGLRFSAADQSGSVEVPVSVQRSSQLPLLISFLPLLTQPAAYGRNQKLNCALPFQVL